MEKKKADNATQRAHVFYGGRVQGVGFRYTAEAIAQRLGLKGFVKNLPDGRVEVVCEGPRDRIDSFLQEVLACGLGRHIQTADCQWETPTLGFKDFSVEFHY